MIVYQQQPLNVGTPPGLLRRSFITPTRHFFIREHGTQPTVNEDSYRLLMNGLVQRQMELSCAELRMRFPAHTMSATIECAGNRRDELTSVRPIPGEVPWGAGAISTANWRGVLLRDVLSAVGIGEGAYYVAFVGMDEAQMEGQQHNFGSSITLERALSTDVLLAYEMNNEPLTPQHGFPLRVIVPGCIGVKSVKWLRSITLQEQPSTNYFYAHDYKLFPPDVTKETADWNCGKVLEEIPLNSVICDPQAGQTCKAGPQRIQGYALTGQGASIERVELSTDGGVHWLTTNIVERSDPWAWCLWEANVDLAPGPCQLVVRAWDTRQHTQPERMEPLWNFKGYVNNAWHRVQVQVV